jgi:hypothetical protein
MKTFIHNFKTPLRCGRLLHLLKTGLSDWPSLFSSSEYLLPLSLVVKKTTLSLKSSALASQAVAIPAAVTANLKAWCLHGRIYLAMLLFCASPLGFTIHTHFDRKVIYPWMGFIENWFHLFNMIGPYIFCLLISTGFCLMIPPKQKTFKVFKWGLNVTLTRIAYIPIGVTIAKICWLCMTSSNEDFWAIPNYSFFIVGLMVGYIMYRIIEYMTWRKYHAFDGLVASIEGLYQIDIDEDLRREKIKPLLQELKEFHLKY